MGCRLLPGLALPLPGVVPGIAFPPTGDAHLLPASVTQAAPAVLILVTLGAERADEEPLRIERWAGFWLPVIPPVPLGDGRRDDDRLPEKVWMVEAERHHLADTPR